MSTYCWCLLLFVEKKEEEKGKETHIQGPLLVNEGLNLISDEVMVTLVESMNHN